MKNNPKIIAHYLPQFHDVSENNAWWGDGFTEWTNVKRAKPLYPNHDQPRIPLQDDYYDILDKDTRKWQADIAKKYWVDGFCYYHYWFKGSKLLLEKPAELLLKDGEPNIPFCFSWWNGNWARTWEGQPEEILMLQEYGDEAEWKAHFEYLLPFFQSPLYIRKNDKPVFLIHYSKHMENILEPMIKKWNEWARENNIPGIYIVEVITSAQNKPYTSLSSGVLEFEPLHTVRNWITPKLIPMICKHVFNRVWKHFFHQGFFINTVSYSGIWDIIVRKQPKRNPQYAGKDILFWGFVWWDNSPRKWKDSLIVTGGTPKVFQKYFQKHYQNAKNENVDFIFLNAWNEWAEWAYLEPDKTNGYGYLEAISAIKKENA